MDSLRPNSLKRAAAERLGSAKQARQILLIFCGILFALCVVITGGNYILDDMMADAGGLGGLGKRSVISTLQTMLPIADMLVMLVLELGLWNAMLRIARGQHASPQSLKMGLSRFFPWLRCLLLQLVLCLLIGFLLTNIAMVIFFATPLSHSMIEQVVPLTLEYADTTALMEAMMADDALLLSLFDAVIPMYVILGVLAAIVFVPVFYRLRLARLLLIDQPRLGSLRALTESFRLTKLAWKWFVKLDLSYWWYYLLQALSSATLYLDSILIMLGRPLPMSSTAGAFLSYGIYLASQIALFYFLRPGVQVSEAVLYDALLPKRQETQGVVLGNIFRM